MRETLTTAGAVIDALGGTTALARLTGNKAQVVSNWRSFGRFPPRTYLFLTGALAEIGKSAPDHLWGMDPPPARRPEQAVSA